MTTDYKSCLFLAATAVLVIAGCVPPGKIDNDVINRYQKAMAGRSPQQRLGTAGLEQLRPAGGTTGPELRIITDAETGRARVELSLDEAVMRALANNVEIRVASFDPAISREEMVKAAAEFDHVLFGSAGYERTDVRTDSTFGGGVSDVDTYEAGIKQKTVLGTTWSLAWAMTRTWDNSTFRTLATRYEPTMILEVTQPLLRNAWSEFNLATLRLARLNRRTSISEFRAQVEQIVTDVTATYWKLVQARKDLAIQQELLAETRKTLEMVEARRGLDATEVEVKQVKASVALRQAVLIRAERRVLDVQDKLAQLLADAQINVLRDFEIAPTTKPNQTLAQIDATDQLVTALQNSPLLEQARLAIAMADINVSIAENQTLPKLDLAGLIKYQGLGQTAHEAHEKLGTLNYLSYTIALSLEYPIGNRERRADLRSARFERLKAITQLQDTADKVALAVYERVRRVRMSYQEILAQRAAVAAAKKQLSALEDIEQIRGRLTPEFLRVKLSAQEQLAVAERDELQAIVDHNTAMIDLARITGTVLKLPSVRILLPAAEQADWSTQDMSTQPKIKNSSQNPNS
ncbi:MAG: TolC family protein [Phycisphaerae bacterium]|nr:TolC family protein [Phycisphaerae bacterium]